MGDRFRLGELLALIGSAGLTVMLIAGTWLQYSTAGITIPGLLPDQFVTGGLGVLGLGWLVALLLAFAALGGLAFIFRVFTAQDTERPMLQAPIAYAAAFVATPVLLLRLTLLRPNATDVGSVTGPEGALVQLAGEFPTTVTPGGWLGLLFLLLILIGTWQAMEDERTHTPAARAQTDALLAGLPRRTVPQPATAAVAATGSTHKQDEAASAEDQLPTEDDPTTPPEDSP